MDVNGDYFMVYKPTNITGGPHPVQQTKKGFEDGSSKNLDPGGSIPRLRSSCTTRNEAPSWSSLAWGRNSWGLRVYIYIYVGLNGIS